MDKTVAEESSRKAYEAEYWDREVSGRGNFRGYFYTQVNQHVWKQIFRELGDLKDKRVLFVGCGTTAHVAKEMARRGADVWCVDISPESISRLMKHPYGPLKDRIHAVVADAEDVPLDNSSIDVVLAKAIVHHLDIERFLAEIKRVAAPGALIVFSEPLGTNPFIRLFRWLTPAARVPTEHPLTRADLHNIAGHCTSLKKHYNFMLALAAIPWFFLGLGRLGRFLFRIGCAVDRVLLVVFPAARLLAWNVTLVGHLGSEEQADRTPQDQ